MKENEKQKNIRTPNSGSSIVKREVKRQFFIFHSFTALFFSCSWCWCCYCSQNYHPTKHISMACTMYMGTCNFILRVPVHVLFSARCFFCLFHSISKIKHSWWWCLSLQKLWAAKTYLLCACDAFNDFNECIYHKMKRSQHTQTHSRRNECLHILLV